MSRERELLKRVRDTLLGLKETHYDLYWDIQTALDLREDLREEPVAWMQDSIELYVLEEKSTVRGYVIPLYTAPPKREPLSEEQIRGLDDDVSWFADSYTFRAVMRLIRSVEKAHGITGGGE